MLFLNIMQQYAHLKSELEPNLQWLKKGRFTFADLNDKHEGS